MVCCFRSLTDQGGSVTPTTNIYAVPFPITFNSLTISRYATAVRATGTAKISVGVQGVSSSEIAVVSDDAQTNGLYWLAIGM